LTKRWDALRPLDEAALDECARHACCISLTPNAWMASCRYVTETELEAAQERLCRLLESWFERGIAYGAEIPHGD
jgi:hypothetical protein